MDRGLVQRLPAPLGARYLSPAEFEEILYLEPEADALSGDLPASLGPSMSPYPSNPGPAGPPPPSSQRGGERWPGSEPHP
jgi:hypothetical protein